MAPPALALATQSHPLNQLVPAEIRMASHMCKAHATALGIPQLRFISVMLLVGAALRMSPALAIFQV